MQYDIEEPDGSTAVDEIKTLFALRINEIGNARIT